MSHRMPGPGWFVTRPRETRGAAIAWCRLAVFALAIGCRDATIGAPDASRERPLASAVAVSCRVDLASREAACATGAPGTGTTFAAAAAAALEHAAPAPSVGWTRDIVTIGGQGSLLTLSLHDVVLSGDTLLVMTAALRNLLDQPLGIVPGGRTPEATGVRLGIVSVSVLGNGTAQVWFPDGTQDFGTGGPIPYMQFLGPILPNNIERRDLSFRLSGGASSFTFRALVRASLTDEAPARLSGNPPRVIDVSLGRNFGGGGCLLTDTAASTPSPDGRAWCWGGVSTLGIPVPNVIAPSPAGGPRLIRLFRDRSSSEGGGGLCGMRTDGMVLCWGFVDSDRIAATSSAARQGTTLAYPGRPLADFALGGSHSCAIDYAGVTWCSGNNFRGQLGNGYIGGALGTASRVRSLPPMRRVSAGSDFTCGVSVAGAVFCWGSNEYGQIGDGTPTDRATPVRVALPDSVISVVTGAEHACALDRIGAVWCWGANDNGAVGNGTQSAPVRVPYLTLDGGMIEIDAGSAHTCVIAAGTNDVFCWGSNAYGQSGQVSNAVIPAPALVSGPSLGAGAIVAAAQGTCVSPSIGVWRCWGENTDGQLGLSSQLNNFGEPQLVSELGGIEGITFGADGGCGLRFGNLWCWGLGVGLHFPRYRPLFESPVIGVAGGLVFRSVARGLDYACGLRPTGAVWCWGRNPIDGSVLVSPDSLATTQRFHAIAVGDVSGCGLRQSDSTAWCWGRNDFGSLGRPGDPSAVPVQVTGSTRFRRIGVGGAHACAIDLAGAPWCWGLNDSGQLGRGTADFNTNATPQLAAGGQQFQDLALGSDNSCGVTAAGGVVCWGSNFNNKLGLGVVATAPSPTQVSIGIQVRRVSLGSAMTCGVSAAGTAFCHGTGNLGDGNFNGGVLRQVRIPTALQRVEAGLSGGCAIDFSQRLWCWGDSDPSGNSLPTLLSFR